MPSDVPPLSTAITMYSAENTVENNAENAENRRKQAISDDFAGITPES